MAKYGKKAQAKVREVMEEFAAGKLKSGRAGKTVTSRRQAVAIGLAEAREAGAKVPPSGKGKKASAKKPAAKKKTAGTPKPKAGRKKAKKKSKKKATKKQGAR
jgi:hypothetical protein